MEALFLFRKAIQNKLPIDYVRADDGADPLAAPALPDMTDATHVRFPAETPPRAYALMQPSCYKQYTLESIAFFIQFRDADFAVYFTNCLTSGRVQVATLDSKDLLKFLRGELATLPFSTPTTAPTTISASIKPSSPTSGKAITGKHLLDVTASPGGVDVTPTSAEPNQLETNTDDSAKRRKTSNELESAGYGTSKNARTKIEPYSNDIEFSKKILSRERTLINRTTVLHVRDQKGFKNFSQLQKIAYDTYSKHMRNDKATPGSAAQANGNSGSQNNGTTNSIVASSRTNTSSSSSGRSTTRRDPIIIVPNAPTSLVSLYNVQELLQDERFTHPRTYMESVAPKPTDVSVTHTLPTGVNRRFKVVDTPARIAKGDWDRVVAVFAFGAEWQFRDYKWSTPVELFHNVCGFYLQFADEAPHPVVSSWNVKVLKVHRERRHLDSTTVHEFWGVLEKWMTQHGWL